MVIRRHTSIVGQVSIWLLPVIIGLVAGLATAIEPRIGLAGIGVVLVLLVAFYCVLNLPQWIFFLLVTKPLVDLAWRWRFLEVAEQGVNVQTVVAVLAILVTIFAVLARRKGILLDGKGIFLLLVAILSVLFTPTSWGINELARLYAGTSFLFTAGAILSQADTFNKFAKYFILAVFIPVVLSFLQRVGVLPYEYWDWIEGEMIGRVSGTYQHPLGLIYFLIYAIPLSLYLLSYSRLSQLSRMALWLFIALSLLAVVFTYHRTALVAIGIEIWLWMVLTKKYWRATLVVLLGIGAAVLLRDWLMVLYQNLAEIVQGKVAFSSGAFLRGRGMNWYLFLSSLFGSHPFYWLFGRGGSVAEGWVPEFGYWVSNEPHNDFIRILHAYGLLGLGLYLSILASFFWKARFLHRQRETFSRGLGNLVIVIMVAIILLSITTEPMRYPTGVWYLFALGSVANVKYHHARKAIS